MPSAFIPILALLAAMIVPAAADPAREWLGTVVGTTAALSRHSDLRAVSTPYEQRLTVRFEIGKDGRVGRADIRRDKAGREAQTILYRLVKDLVFPPPPHMVRQRSFTQMVIIAPTLNAEKISREADRLNRQIHALRQRYGISEKSR